MGGEDSHKTYLIKTYIQSIYRTPINPFFLKKWGRLKLNLKIGKRLGQGFYKRELSEQSGTIYISSGFRKHMPRWDEMCKGSTEGNAYAGKGGGAGEGEESPGLGCSFDIYKRKQGRKKDYIERTSDSVQF